MDRRPAERTRTDEKPALFLGDSNRYATSGPWRRGPGPIEGAPSMGERPVTRRPAGIGWRALVERYGRRRSVTGALLFVAVALAFWLPSATDRALLGHRILRGVWAGPVALSALRREEAERVLQEQASRLQRGTLTVRVGPALVKVTAEDVRFTVNVEATVEAALRAGRAGGLLARTTWWWRRWASPELIRLVTAVDPVKVSALADRLDRQVIERRPFGGGLTVDRGNVLPVLPHGGFVVDRARLADTLAAAFSAPSAGSTEVVLREEPPPLDPAVVAAAASASRVLIAGPVVLVDPSSDEQLEVSAADLGAALAGRTELSPRPQLVAFFRPEVIADRLHSTIARLERAPRDARFEVDHRNRVHIVPEAPGVRLDPALLADALVLAARAPGRIGTLPLDRAAEPAKREADLRALGIKGLVSEFTTYHPCCRPRVENIHRIADLLDGTVIEPGQTFSVNAAVGPRTTKNGFVPAPTIEEGEMVDSVGGGISQFATTLFNAVFHGGYDIIERTPHSYYFARYPMGHEATLSYPKPDLVFRNDTAAGMLLVCRYGKTFVKVQVFGDNGGRKVQAKVSPRRDIQKPRVEYVANAARPPDEEKVLEPGSIGWTVTVSRVIAFPDGTRREETRKVTYNPRVRRVEVHPCRIPEGEKGYTGEDCPVPEDDSEDAPSEDGGGAIPDSIAEDSPLDEGF